MAKEKKQYLQLKIELEDTKPLVWRRLVVPADFRLNQLHAAIQIAFGWQNKHLYVFIPEYDDQVLYTLAALPNWEGEQTLASEASLQYLIEQENLEYIYDMNAQWTHFIHLEEMLVADQLNNEPAPFCVTGRGANEREDSDNRTDTARVPFNKAKINTALQAAFPTENAMPRQYETVNTDAADLTEETSILSDDGEPPLAEEWTEDKIDAVMHALVQLPEADTRLFEELSQDLMFREVPAEIEQYAVVQLLAKRLLLFRVDASPYEFVENRLRAAELVTGLINNDIRSEPFLDSDQRSALIDQVEELVSHERNDVRPASTGQQTGLESALELLLAVIAYKEYNAKRAQDLDQTLLKMLDNLTAPFAGHEADMLAILYYRLLETRKVTARKMIGQLENITKKVGYHAVINGGGAPLLDVQQTAWAQALTVLDVMLMHYPKSTTVLDYVDGVVTKRLGID
ncbi:plasmid pRiA4b ORF-3 family protein [Schleiferilactobacillus shenzhenensis]|uniref:Plasmid pRiA4b Orf3-like domain-containing protein n=1 Tax=Schleiferilactobacillus shenzhenensis LY-73 TaxID=1231336 RepID=U4TQ27_9LACO|nr:plasmid pRiA4b ORF-3 family protein [Schleiferilactobacillus shenzhenensis]ERL63632.1 hypothetical protein L248_2503 [Schleiferilactobacillus shenzhenensis LY-73]